MSYDFFAFLSRMKYIKRWSLMYSVVSENVMEHTAETTIIAHALASIRNRLFGGTLDEEKVLLYALYHETGEVITGDLPTPIKYFNKDINSAYRTIEENAAKKILAALPEELRPIFSEAVIHDADSEEYRVVKSADKIAALIKCMEEIKAGNTEFRKAEASIKKELSARKDPEVVYFMENFLPSYKKALDELDCD